MPSVTLAPVTWVWATVPALVRNTFSGKQTPPVTQQIFPAIPQPQPSLVALHRSVLALKQTVERLSGSGSDTSAQAAAISDLQQLVSNIDARLRAAGI